MIVAIDGPAGAGKSSVSRQLAERIGFDFLDTGAMYRCVTLAAMRQGIPWENQPALIALASTLQISFDGSDVLLNGEVVSPLIRTPEVTQNIRNVANLREIRLRMIQLQREFAEGRNVVTEGRDQATEAFPSAECKIFLTASPEERARRRVSQLCEIGQPANYEEILEMQNRRDEEDSRRPFGALRQAEDSELVLTDGLTPTEVIDRLEQIVRKKWLSGR